MLLETYNLYFYNKDTGIIDPVENYNEEIIEDKDLLLNVMNTFAENRVLITIKDITLYKTGYIKTLEEVEEELCYVLYEDFDTLKECLELESLYYEEEEKEEERLRQIEEDRRADIFHEELKKEEEIYKKNHNNKEKNKLIMEIEAHKKRLEVIPVKFEIDKKEKHKFTVKTSEEEHFKEAVDFLKRISDASYMSDVIVKSVFTVETLFINEIDKNTFRKMLLDFCDKKKNED